MSRVKEAQDNLDSIKAYTEAEAAPTAFVNDRFLDRVDVAAIMANIMKSLAVIADSVNKEEKE